MGVPSSCCTTPSERIGRCTRMRRFFVRFNRPESFAHTRSSAGFTVITSGFEFSVHTAAASTHERAARFGVSPTIPSSCASPDPIRSPITTNSVATPTPVCSGALTSTRPPHISRFTIDEYFGRRTSYRDQNRSRAEKRQPGTSSSRTSDAPPREAEPCPTRCGGWMGHPAAVEEPRPQFRTKSYSGAPRPMKMGTTPSRFPYDAEARDTLQSASLRCSAI